MDARKAKIKAIALFKSVTAQREFYVNATYSYVYEAGVDAQGNIYFAYLDGYVTRFERKRFLRYAKKNETFAKEVIASNVPESVKDIYRKYLSINV